MGNEDNPDNGVLSPANHIFPLRFIIPFLLLPGLLVVFAYFIPDGGWFVFICLIIWGAWIVRLLKKLVRQVDEGKKHSEMAQKKQLYAQTAYQAKSLFLVNMSHEIRTPLNSILGMVEILQEAALSREHLHYLSITHAASENLLALVNTISDLTRLESGQLLLEERSLDLSQITSTICQMMALRVKGKPVVAKCHMADNLPNHLLGDGARLAQILFHLSANGVKYTDKGRVILTVNLASQEEIPVATVQNSNDETKTWLTFKMVDTGGGMSAERLTILRQGLQHPHPWNSDIASGVGLFLCQNLVKRMGGVLHIESEEGKGSTVGVVLPFHLKPESDNPFVRLQVLIIHEDNQQRLRLKELLQDLGCKSVALAENGQQGLTLFGQSCTTPPALGMVILECGLSDMEWMRLGGEIRLMAPTTSLVLMPHGQCSQEILRQSAIRINATLPPPITSETLAQTLKFAMQHDSLLPHPLQPTSRERGTAEKPWRILTVDDSEDSILLMHAYLRGQPFRVDSASNGVMALEKLRFNRYDLIFMDLQMPVLDGLEATRKFRQWEEEHQENKTPIIALTAHPLGMNEEQAMAAGCDLYLTKPIRKQDLLDKINAMLPT